MGTMAVKSEMQTEVLPVKSVTTRRGEVADEVHEWPNATQGPRSRHLTLQFREGRLIQMIWKFQPGITKLAPSKARQSDPAPPRKKPWWRF